VTKTKKLVRWEERATSRPGLQGRTSAEDQRDAAQVGLPGLRGLGRQVGNQAVQRFVVQRNGSVPAKELERAAGPTVEQQQAAAHIQRTKVMGSVHRQPTREHGLSQRTMVQRETSFFAEQAGRQFAQLKAKIRREVSWTHVATDDLQDPAGRTYELRIYQAKTGGTPWTVRHLVWCLSARRHQNTMPQYYVMTPSHGHKLELLYPSFKKEGYAPVYQPGRFYTLKERGRYHKLGTYLRNVPYRRKEAKRREHARQEVRGQESRLRRLFRGLWPRIRRALLKRLPENKTLSNVNFNVILLQHTGKVRGIASSALRSVSVAKIPGAFEITEAQAEKGVLFTRGKNLPTITIDLIHGTVADIGLGDLQADAKGGMTRTVNFGKYSLGIHWKILHPISEQTTWKLGYRDSRSAGTVDGYKREPYAQFLIEGRLGSIARGALLATYGVSAAVLSAKVASAASAAPAALEAALYALKAGAPRVGSTLARWLWSKAPALALG